MLCLSNKTTAYVIRLCDCICNCICVKWWLSFYTATNEHSQRKGESKWRETNEQKKNNWRQSTCRLCRIESFISEKNAFSFSSTSLWLIITRQCIKINNYMMMELIIHAENDQIVYLFMLRMNLLTLPLESALLYVYILYCCQWLSII